MRFFYYLDRDQFIQQPGVAEPLTEISGFKRGTKVPLEVQFLTGESADIKVTLDSGTALQFGLKVDGEFDGDFLASVESADWTAPVGSSQDPFYTATLNLNTTELETAFLTPDGDATNDAATVAAMAGFDITGPGADAPRSADTLTVSIANKVVTGVEGLAVGAGPAIETRLTTIEGQVGHNIVSSTITGFTGGGSAKLDGVVTVGLSVGTIIQFATAANCSQIFRLDAGTNAEDSPFIVRPDDYNASTNAKYWRNVTYYLLARMSYESYTALLGTILNNAPADNVLAYQNSSSTGFTTHAFNDHLGNLRAVFGWGNSGSAVPSTAYWWVNDASVRRAMEISQVVGATAYKIIAIGTDGNITFGGALIESQQALSGAGAVDIVSGVTRLTTTGIGNALTLANGAAGQRKTIIHEVDGGSAVLTPTTKTGFTTITFTNAGDSCVLVYLATRGWMIQSLYGAVAA